jgi:poly-gamma-glutamate capsule biosynthesis protein CapA/YwtB (metallophosphatase superfamily)
MISRRAFLSLPLAAAACTRRSADARREPAARPRETRIVFGGDVMMSRYVGHLARVRNDTAWPMRDLAPFLRSADIAFVNLEAPFSDRGRKVESGMIFKAEPEMVEALKLAGIDIVSTANNHARDCGAYGVSYTWQWLAMNGIAAAGTGMTPADAHSGVVLKVNGVRFGFLAYTYDQSNGNYRDVDARIALMNPADLVRDIASLRKRADVIVVSMHAGVEYRPKPNAQQQAFAHLAIDRGARIVVGAHPHVVQPVERYRGGVIFYSLGNLVFDQFQRKETQRGELAEVVFRGADLVRWRVVPVDIVRTVPRLAREEVAGPSANRRGAGQTARLGAPGRIQTPPPPPLHQP